MGGGREGQSRGRQRGEVSDSQAPQIIATPAEMSDQSSKSLHMSDCVQICGCVRVFRASQQVLARLHGVREKKARNLVEFHAFPLFFFQKITNAVFFCSKFIRNNTSDIMAL